MTDITLSQTTTDITIVDGGLEINLQPESVTSVILGVPGSTGPAGADGDVVTIVEIDATVGQTEFAILATATALRIFDINGISYLPDVSIDPPGSGNVVYTGDYILEADDTVTIGYITT